MQLTWEYATWNLGTVLLSYWEVPIYQAPPLTRTRILRISPLLLWGRKKPSSYCNFCLPAIRKCALVKLDHFTKKKLKKIPSWNHQLENGAWRLAGTHILSAKTQILPEEVHAEMVPSVQHGSSHGISMKFSPKQVGGKFGTMKIHDISTRLYPKKTHPYTRWN